MSASIKYEQLYYNGKSMYIQLDKASICNSIVYSAAVIQQSSTVIPMNEKCGTITTNTEK